MPSYTAPVKDMMFLFEKLRDNKNYNELEKYNEVSADLVKDILEEAAKINQNLIYILTTTDPNYIRVVPLAVTAFTTNYFFPPFIYLRVHLLPS